MKKVIYTFAFIFIASTVKAADCNDCRYASLIFDSVTVIKNLHFAAGPDLNNANQDLYLDIYQPYGDTETNRPVFIFAFGGGFVQGSKEDDYVVLVCERFAKAGYVAVAIDYRIGINYVAGIANPTGEAMKVFFRPMQDMRASVQYMKHSFAEKGNLYGIDTSKIIIGGASAGGITALNVAYCDKDSEYADLGPLSNISSLGGFYSSSALDTFSAYSWNSTGVLNIAGAIFNTDWIEAGDPPVYSAHGDQDEVVPYKDDNPTSGYLGFIGMKMEGSYLVDSVANARGVCSYLYTLVGEDHPSGGKPISYYEGILIRGTSRFYSLVHNQSFCCTAEVEITPPNPVYVQQGQTITFSGEIRNGSVPPNYLWCSYPCEEVRTAQSFQIQPDTGKYQILLVNDGGCNATDFVGVFDVSDSVSTSSVRYLYDNGLNALIYPNPASEKLVVKLSDVSEYEVRLINITGSTVSREVFTGNETILKTDNVAAGVYVLQIVSGRRTMQTKVIIQ